VEKPDEADICFPDCWHGAHITKVMLHGRWKNQQSIFRVNPNSRLNNFMGCRFVSFNMEMKAPWNTRCDIEAPYFHGIYAPGPKWAVAPWTLGLKRDTLLGFFGSTQRGAREFTVQQALAYSAAHSGDADAAPYTALFKAPFQQLGMQNESLGALPRKLKNTALLGQDKIIHESDKPFLLAWQLYATSVYCLQPGGDSATRRGFFDSLLFGCIPVISMEAAEHYTKLYQGTIFNRRESKIEDIAVVLPLRSPTDTLVPRLLALTTPEDVARRQARLAKIAPSVQWGWKADDHAMKRIFDSVTTTALRPKELCPGCGGGSSQHCKDPEKACYYTNMPELGLKYSWGVVAGKQGHS